MNGYLISGIQQMGIGVLNVSEAFGWYIDHFGMDCRIFEEEAEAKLMLPYTGGKPRSRHAILALNLQSGGGFEIWQYKGREPKVSTTQIQAGDLGIFSCKMKVKNIDSALKTFREKKMSILGDPIVGPDGKKTFFSKDPYGNIFQFVEATDWFMEENKVTGGAYGVIIGVTDIERAKTIYCDILGYDKDCIMIKQEYLKTLSIYLAGKPTSEGYCLKDHCHFQVHSVKFSDKVLLN